MRFLTLILLLSTICFAGYAIGQEMETISMPKDSIGLFLYKLLGTDFEKWVGALVGLSAVLKGAAHSLGSLSAALEGVAEKSEAKWDNKVVKGLTSATKFATKTGSYLAWLLGLFGMGNMPKAVKHTPKLPMKKPS